MQELRMRVITAACSHPRFPEDVAERIRLATTHAIQQWFCRAFEELLLKPLSTLGNDDMEDIGADVVYHLIKRRHEMEKCQTLNLARCPRFVLHWDCCYRRGQCKKAWEEFWAETLAPAALAHHQGLCGDLLRQYTLTNRSDGMCDGCMDRNISLLSISQKSDLMEVQAAEAALYVWRVAFDNKDDIDGEEDGFEIDVVDTDECEDEDEDEDEEEEEDESREDDNVFEYPVAN